MTPPVFVHGFMGGGGQWACQMETFAKDFNFLTVDLPGFCANATLKVPSTIAGFAEFVFADLSARGIDRLILDGTRASGILPGRFETIETSKIRAKTDGVCATARHTGNRRKPPRRDTELRRSSGSGHTRPFVTLGRQISKVSASRHPLQISTMHPKFTGLVAFDRIS